MSATRFYPVAVALVAALAPTVAFAQQTARVTLAAVDSFGNRPAGCHVKYFANDYDPTGKKNPDPRDFSEQFSPLIGRDIPFDLYSVVVQCAGKYRWSAQIWIRHPETFFVVPTTQRRGDYHTGLTPRLTVSIERVAASKTRADNTRWITMSGLFWDLHETDQVDPLYRVAQFYDIVPGRYLLQVVEPGRLVCKQQIDFLEAGASLVLVDDDPCTVKSAESARIVK